MTVDIADELRARGLTPTSVDIKSMPWPSGPTDTNHPTMTQYTIRVAENPREFGFATLMTDADELRMLVVTTLAVNIGQNWSRRSEQAWLRLGLAHSQAARYVDNRGWGPWPHQTSETQPRDRASSSRSVLADILRRPDDQ